MITWVLGVAFSRKPSPSEIKHIEERDLNSSYSIVPAEGGSEMIDQDWEILENYFQEQPATIHPETSLPEVEDESPLKLPVVVQGNQSFSQEQNEEKLASECRLVQTEEIYSKCAVNSIFHESSTNALGSCLFCQNRKISFLGIDPSCSSMRQDLATACGSIVKPLSNTWNDLPDCTLLNAAKFLVDPLLFSRLHSELGHYNVTISEWIPDMDSNNGSGLVRSRKIVTKTNAPVGPSETRVDIVDRISFNEDQIILTSASQSIDAMFATDFRIHSRIVLQPRSRGELEPLCHLQRTAEVCFLKPIRFWKSIIQREVHNSIRAETAVLSGLLGASLKAI